MDLLSDLNPQQQQAVSAGSGPILVMAGPGSGKTRVLTRRVAYLVGMLGVRPYSILAVTFTNKAAREMGSRVRELIGDAPGLTLGTFHSVCARILRREAEHLPFQNNFVIFDQDDQTDLVKRAILDLNLDEKRYKPAGIHASISAAKNELILPEGYPIQNYRDELVRRVYTRYQELLLANNSLDFDDLLLWTAWLLEENSEVRDRYSRRYEHILVDEFQDTNTAQYRLLRQLASFHGNLFVVGDADQSIYRWRGADYRNVLRFEEDFPDSQVILLEQNYRSTQQILDVAMAVIDRNPQRRAKRLFTERGEGKKTVLYEAYDDRVEAAFVVDTIRSLTAQSSGRSGRPGEYSPGDFAVMYRTNAQSRLLEEAFLTAGMPYRLVGAQRFYGRKEIKDIIAYMRLIHNPDDELSLTRAINSPARGIGGKTFLALRTYAQQLEISPGRLLLEMSRSPEAIPQEVLSGRARAALFSFAGMLAGWLSARETSAPLALMDRVLADSRYQEFVDDGTEEGHDRWENLLELRRVASEHSEPGLDEFLEQVALVSDQDTLEGSQNAPTLLTLHAAKGLEFPVVFICGLNDGVLPHSRSFDDPEEMMEEVRLLYVGITRAKDRLYLLFSQNRAAFGYSESAIPSRFIDYIPYHLIDEDQSDRQTPGRRSSGERREWTGRMGREREDRSQRWESRPSRAAVGAQAKAPAPARQRFSPGMHVRHPAWGDGMVLNSKMQDGDEIVDVHFAGVGLKRLVASLAPLEIKV